MFLYASISSLLARECTESAYRTYARHVAARSRPMAVSLHIGSSSSTHEPAPVFDFVLHSRVTDLARITSYPPKQLDELIARLTVCYDQSGRAPAANCSISRPIAILPIEIA